MAIDIMGGKCVRLTKGDFGSRKVYSSDPVELAREIEGNGLKYLHLVDLDGAEKRKVMNIGILEKISGATGLRIDYSGGLRSREDVDAVFKAGAKQVTLGSVAVSNRPLFLQLLAEFGPDRIILGADSMNGSIASCGWLEKSDKDVIAFISSYASQGVKYTVCTDIEKDGTLLGPSISLYREILSEVKINLIASGGVSSMSDLYELSEAGCEAAIIGKAVYEGKITMKNLVQYAEEKNNSMS